MRSVSPKTVFATLALVMALAPQATAQCTNCNEQNGSLFLAGDCSFSNTMQLCDAGTYACSAYACVVWSGSNFSWDTGENCECSPW